MADPRTRQDAATVVKTLPQLAESLGVHRSTLVRLEQKGIIPAAPLAGPPVQGRVYDEKLERKVIAAYEKWRTRKAVDANRPAPPENFIVGGR